MKPKQLLDGKFKLSDLSPEELEELSEKQITEKEVFELILK